MLLRLRETGTIGRSPPRVLNNAGFAQPITKRLLGNKENFDAIVLDIMLPGKDGFSVVAELRAARNYVPVLMLTARSRPEDVLKGFAAGADDYLPKPFNPRIG